MNATWLKNLYEEAGLSAEHAAKAAQETLARMLRRERPPPKGGDRRSLRDFFVRDPLVSVGRIVGRGDGELPFLDEETGKLSAIAFGNLLSDVGLDPVVAMAYARVVVEAFEPADLYEPIWRALSGAGEFTVEGLRQLDWSPLRGTAGLASSSVPPAGKAKRAKQGAATVVTRTVLPQTPIKAAVPSTTIQSETTVSVPIQNSAGPLKRGPRPKPKKR